MALRPILADGLPLSRTRCQTRLRAHGHNAVGENTNVTVARRRRVASLSRQPSLGRRRQGANRSDGAAAERCRPKCGGPEPSRFLRTWCATDFLVAGCVSQPPGTISLAPGRPRIRRPHGRHRARVGHDLSRVKQTGQDFIKLASVWPELPLCLLQVPNPAGFWPSYPNGTSMECLPKPAFPLVRAGLESPASHRSARSPPSCRG
jgi:hypothetical protein